MNAPQALPTKAAPGTNRSIPLGAVRLGDIVFDWDGRMWSHATIVTETWNGGAMHTHAVKRGLSGVWETTLFPEANRHVVRCKRDGLRDEAAAWAKVWAKYLIPYSLPRKDRAETMDAQPLAGGIVAKHRELFEIFGKWRAIKYAARRKSYLCYPGENGAEGQGMICGQFVALCFQVAGIAPCVTEAKVDHSIWVSDKRLDEDALRRLKPYVLDQVIPSGRSKQDWEGYLAYCESLHETNPYRLVDVNDPERCPARFERVVPREKPVSKPRPGVEYLPSILFWNYSRYGDISALPWADFITTGMLVDSKVVMPASLYESLMADPANWEDLGQIAGESQTPGEHEKLAYKAQLDQTRQQAGAIKDKFFKR